MSNRFLSLEFFSSYFNFPVENLSWGIAEYSSGESSPKFAPCVIVKDTGLAIDINQAGLVSEIVSPLGYTKFHAAELAKDFDEPGVWDLESTGKIKDGETVYFEMTENDLEKIYYHPQSEEPFDEESVY